MLKKIGLHRGIIVVSLFLLVGLVGSTGLVLASRSDALDLVNEPTDIAPSAALKPAGLPDFVSLAKKIKPVVVNVSTVQVTRGRVRGFANPLVERIRSVNLIGDFLVGRFLEARPARKAWDLASS